MIKMGCFSCGQCLHTFDKWPGPRCPECSAFAMRVGAPPAKARTARQAPPQEEERLFTGLFIDSVFGGFVPGSTVLLIGGPGTGKTTLALQMLDGLQKAGESTLFISAEQSHAAVARLAERLDALDVPLLSTSAYESIEPGLTECDASIGVVDSVQTFSDVTADGPPGSYHHLRELLPKLGELAADTNVCLILLSQINGEGDASGGHSLTHLVDVVAHLESDGEKVSLHTTKNRHGKLSSVDMLLTEKGMVKTGSIPLPETDVQARLDALEALVQRIASKTL